MKLVYCLCILYFLQAVMLTVNTSSLKTATTTNTKVQSQSQAHSTAKSTTSSSSKEGLTKAQIEELEKLEKAKLAKLEEEKAKLELEEKLKKKREDDDEDGKPKETSTDPNKPTKEQLENMTPEDRKLLLEKAQQEEAGKEAIKNVPILNLEGDIYWRGWVKYFHYESDQKIDKPNHFYENPNYFKEIVKLDKRFEKMNGHFKYIQDKYHFWCKLLANGNLNILGSRVNEVNTLADNVENLNTDLIGYVHPDNNASGAIKDLGSFNEGHCISIETINPPNTKDPAFNPRTQAGDPIIWVICTDLEKSKKDLMSYLISMKIKRQKTIDDVGLEEEKSTLSVAELMKAQSFKPKVEKYTGRGATKEDGYWIMLQDWSDCSLKCGGGYKIQQWMCVPPTGKGKPCIGEAIRKKDCNKGPCPDVIAKKGVDLPKEDKFHITLKPIFKVLPYSKRNQQYIKCQIKENDVLYLTKEYDPEKKTAMKVPGRIVMNTQTISVYKDDGYDNQLFSFNLATTTFSKAEDDFCCFFLTNANRQDKICGFNNNCGSKDNPVWVAKWSFDFDYFLNKCHKELKQADNRRQKSVSDENHLGVPAGGGPGMPLGQAQQDIVNGRTDIINKKIEAEAEKKMDNKVEDSQKIALTALRREINLEDLIKNEEIQKGKDETQALYNQMNQEKKKKMLLEAALHSRNDNYGKIREAKDTEKKIAGIKKEAKNDIIFKRGVLKKKIEEIRNKFRRKHRQIKQQIQLIRGEIASDIVNANKRGDASKCKDNRNNIQGMKDYCDAKIMADYAKNNECKDPQSFCYVCCQTEFGDMFLADKDNCESMCDDLDKADLADGDWVWNPKEGEGHNKVKSPDAEASKQEGTV